jgi:hypothetical protein
MKSFDESYESFGISETFRKSAKKSVSQTSVGKKFSSVLKLQSFVDLKDLKQNDLKQKKLPQTHSEKSLSEAGLQAKVYKFCHFDPFKKSKLAAESKKKKGKPTPHYAGVNYGSISEAALGILLEELIPDFCVQEGKTYQLPLGGGRTVDFLIENTLVEFHYPRFFSRSNDLGDFESRKERSDFHKALKRVGRNKHQKKKLMDATHEKLIRNYSLKRRRQIDHSLYGPHTELIVAASASDFYWKVICRFASVHAISEADFIDRFNLCCRSVIKSSKEAWARAA